MIDEKEKLAIRQGLCRLHGEGWRVVQIDDGVGYAAAGGLSVDEAVDSITAVDETWVKFLKDGYKTGVIQFVLGNGPDEVVCDNTRSHGFGDAVDLAFPA